MNDFEKIEHLLLSKRFEELNPTEVKEVTDYFENASDYNDMRDTLMQVKSTLAADKLLIKPSVDLKEKLLQQFDKTYTNATTTSGKTRPFYKNVGFQWAAAASVVIIISLSIFGYINNMGGKKSDEMAVNYKKTNTAPMDESGTSTGETGGKESHTGKREEKEKISVLNPESIDGKLNDQESDKKAVYKNFFVSESEVSEDQDEGANAPVTTNSNNENNLGFSNVDNTTWGIITNTNTNVTKEEKNDADYNLNRVYTNAYRDDSYKGGDNKNFELNTTIPTNSQSQKLGNTTTLIDKDQITNKKDYWGKKKNQRNKTKTDSNKGRLENDSLANGKDSILTNTTDSLSIDSNKNLLKNNESIQMDDNKKDE